MLVSAWLVCVILLGCSVTSEAYSMHVSGLRKLIISRSCKMRLPMGSGDGAEDDLMGESKFKTFDMDSKRQPDGYLNQDIKKMAGEQKSRVLAYIGFALLPCLFLVPFFLSRDFTPPTIE